MQSSFNAGELSPRLDGRSDLQKYASGCQKLENFLPLVQGGALKRSGTRYVKNCHHLSSISHDSRLIPFEYSTEQAYILEFCHLNMRLFRNYNGVPQVVQESGSFVIAEILPPAVSDAIVRPEGATITGASIAAACVITADRGTLDHEFENNEVLRISDLDVGSMVELNDTDFRVVDSKTLTFGIAFITPIVIEDVTNGATTVFTVPASPAHGVAIGDVVWSTRIQEGPEQLNNVLGTVTGQTGTTITVSINTATGYDTYVTGAGRSEGELYLCVNSNALGYAGYTTGGEAYNHGLASSREVYISGVGDPDLDDKFWDITVYNAGHFALNGSGDQGTISGGSPAAWRATVELATPYSGVSASTAGVQQISYAQSADVLYLAHPEFAPRKLTRQADDEWTLEEIEFDWPPFQPLNLDERAKVYAEAETGKDQYLKVEGLTVTGIGDPVTPFNPGFPVLIHVDDHGFVTGDRVTFTGIGGTTNLDDNTYTVRNPTEDSFELENASGVGIDGSGWTVFSGGGTVALAVFDSSALVGTIFRLNEIIGVHHGLWEPASPNSRYGSMSPAVDDRYFEGNVYLNVVQNAADSGTSPPIHTEGIEADGYWTWEYLHSGEGYAEITSKVSGSHVIVDIVERMPKSMSAGAPTDATSRWSFGAWSPLNRYPRAVCFFEDRLWWAGTAANEQTMWASQSGSYQDHRIEEIDESALVFTLNTDQVNTIEWLVPGRQLQIGTAGGEFVVSAASDTEALVPGNVRVVRHSTFGSKEFVAPLQVEQVILFTQRAGRKLRELVYDDPQQSYLAPDMTALADHLSLSGIRWLSFQQEPNKICWAITEDGELLGFTYERDQQVTAWHRHRLGGTFGNFDRTCNTFSGSLNIEVPTGTSVLVLGMGVTGTGIPGGSVVNEILSSTIFRINQAQTASGSALLTFNPQSKVLSIASIPVSGAQRDELWMAVRRTVNGVTRNHVEVMQEDWIRGTMLEDAWFVDAGAQATGSGITAVTGLDHIEGQEVAYLADGIPGTATVSGGSITVPSCDKATAGLAYESTLQTMRLNAGARDGTSQGKISRITDVVLRIDQTGEGLHYGPDEDLGAMDEVALNAGELFGGDTDPLSWPAGYEPQGSRVTIKHVEPTPCTLTAVMPMVKVEDSR
jgi:hypothetical protein